MAVKINIQKHDRTFIDSRGNVIQDPRIKKAPQVNLEQSGDDTGTKQEGGDDAEKEVA